MWKKENMKLVWIFQYFGLGFTDNGLWEYFGFLGCWCFPVTIEHVIECFFYPYPTIAKHIQKVKSFVCPYACTCLSLCMHCVGTNLSFQSCLICKHLQSLLSVITFYVHICIISSIILMILWIFGQKQCAFITIGRPILQTM
jgi:hypothetical protein